MLTMKKLKKCERCKCVPMLKVESLCFISDEGCIFEKRYHYECKCGIKTPFTYQTEEEARRELDQRIVRYDYKFSIQIGDKKK